MIIIILIVICCYINTIKTKRQDLPTENQRHSMTAINTQLLEAAKVGELEVVKVGSGCVVFFLYHYFCIIFDVFFLVLLLLLFDSNYTIILNVCLVIIISYEVYYSDV